MIGPALAFPTDSIPHQTLTASAARARVAVICGIPAMGKSLFLRDLALIARERGRVVHYLQWDVVLQSFNQTQIMARYPDASDVTHPVIRRAAGLWVRDALCNWERRNPDPEHLLIVEAPLVGGRFVELARIAQDDCEAFLRSDLTLFLVPTPTETVRAAIQASRAATAAKPRHSLDEQNARPAVVDALWKEIAEIAHARQVPGASAHSSYSPDLYFAVYALLLRHRRVIRIPVEHTLKAVPSPYAHEGSAIVLTPTTSKARKLIQAVEAGGVDEAVRFAQQWHEF